MGQSRTFRASGAHFEIDRRNGLRRGGHQCQSGCLEFVSASAIISAPQAVRESALQRRKRQRLEVIGQRDMDVRQRDIGNNARDPSLIESHPTAHGPLCALDFERRVKRTRQSGKIGVVDCAEYFTGPAPVIRRPGKRRVAKARAHIDRTGDR